MPTTTLSSTFSIDSDREIQTCLGVFSWFVRTKKKKNRQTGVSKRSNFK